MNLKEKRNVVLLLLGAIAIIIVGVVLIANLGEKEPKVVSKPINEKVNLTEVFNEIEKIEGFEDIKAIENMESNNGFSGENEENEMNNPSENEEKKENAKNQAKIAEEEIDLGKYNILEKKAIVKTDDNYINEVWMIKLGDYSQQEEVSRLLGNRIRKLKEGFRENTTQMQIIEQAVIKQEDGIIIMVISPKIDEVVKTIEKEMNK